MIEYHKEVNMMDGKELVILFIVGLIAVAGMLFIYLNMDATGDAILVQQPYQFAPQQGESCYVDSDCYWAYGSLAYECRAGMCNPKNAIGPPAYATKLKIR